MTGAPAGTEALRRTSVTRATLGLARRAAAELREQGTYDLIGEWVLPYDELQQLYSGERP